MVDRARETKGLLKELQESLVSCESACRLPMMLFLKVYLAHQVTDILRAKILHQASQLADAQARVKELEEQSLTKLLMTAEDNKRHIALLVDMGEYISWRDVVAHICFRQKCRRRYCKIDCAREGGNRRPDCICLS